MPVKAILFDKDGTLLDFERTWGPAIYEIMYTLAQGNAMAMQALAEISLFDLAARRFHGDSPLIAGTNAEYGIDWAKALGVPADAAFIGRMDELALEYGEKYATAFDGVDTVLKDLAGAGITLGVATNDAERSARAQLAVLGVEGLFSFVAGYDSGHGSKPEPGMISAFASATGVAPDEIMMVGDSLHDLQAGRAAGVVAVGVATGFRSAEDLAPHADLVLRDLRDLPLHLARF